jgi:hypothetical protein
MFMRPAVFDFEKDFSKAAVGGAKEGGLVVENHKDRGVLHE